jgi:hypothetical protein
MLDYQKRRDDKMIHAWRVRSGWWVALILAIALALPDPAMPGMTAPRHDSPQISASSDAGGPTLSDLCDCALALHLHFEHHQCVRAESAFLIPVQSAKPAFFSTAATTLMSLPAAPLRRPPRA